MVLCLVDYVHAGIYALYTSMPVCQYDDEAQNAKINKMAPTCQNKNKTSKQPTATECQIGFVVACTQNWTIWK